MGLESTRFFLASRTAFLISGDHLKVTVAETNPSVFTYQASNSTFKVGSASAIDHRGYFLTAAHCVKKEAPYLLFGLGRQLQAEPARVVWRGDVSKGEPDLALLWVPRTLDRVFEWASDFKAGDQVVAVGPNYHPPFDIKVVCFAGTLNECTTRSGIGPRARSISHNAPLHGGDSGGPLVDLDGRLIAINVRVERTFSFLHPLGKRLSFADHPDLPWLYQLIEGHAATQSRAVNQSPNPRSSGDDGVASRLQVEPVCLAPPDRRR